MNANENISTEGARKYISQHKGKKEFYNRQLLEMIHHNKY
jgi:hypothetical protein